MSHDLYMYKHENKHSCLLPYSRLECSTVCCQPVYCSLTVLTRSSFTSGCWRSKSTNEWKKSERSTWRGATHNVSMSAPVGHSNSHSCEINKNSCNDFFYKESL